MVEELKKENALLREQIELLQKINSNNDTIIKARKELSIEILNQVLEYSAWGRLLKLKGWARNTLKQLTNEN